MIVGTQVAVTHGHNLHDNIVNNVLCQEVYRVKIRMEVKGSILISLLVGGSTRY